jgi:hypothetical protein
MGPDYVDWDEPEDLDGNVHYIQASDLTPREVEDILDNLDARAVPSFGSPADAERWIVFGWTSTGRHIAVVFEILCDDPYYVRPITSYDTPEYGEGE